MLLAGEYISTHYFAILHSITPVRNLLTQSTPSSIWLSRALVWQGSHKSSFRRQRAIYESSRVVAVLNCFAAAIRLELTKLSRQLRISFKRYVKLKFTDNTRISSYKKELQEQQYKKCNAAYYHDSKTFAVTTGTCSTWQRLRTTVQA
jgi:hypothetical protein